MTRSHMCLISHLDPWEWLFFRVDSDLQVFMMPRASASDYVIAKTLVSGRTVFALPPNRSWITGSQILWELQKCKESMGQLVKGLRLGCFLFVLRG